jgi:hypothetical protein
MSLSKPAILTIPLLACFLLLCQPFAYGGSIAVTRQTAYSGMARDTLTPDCPRSAEIEKIINDAIALGAPIYNEGLHMACYRIYEWAGYKILYEYGKDCKDVEKILKSAIDKSHGDLSDTEKAWLMRMAFDKILGVPTKTGATEKENNMRKG